MKYAAVRMHQLFFAALIFFMSPGAMAQTGRLPDQFVYVDQWVPDIQVDLRYAGSDNFVGRPIDGYLGHRALLSMPAAQALAKVQAELSQKGLGLKIFDAYRPQRAVDHFVRWASDPNDDKMKSRYFPNVEKGNLFKEGYIAERSGHSRGSTVDLTIVQLTPPHAALDMGTDFDLFGEQSWVDDPTLPPAQRANRQLLQEVMTKHGFVPFPKEWWHFTFQPEPFPKTYFDFVIRDDLLAN